MYAHTQEALEYRIAATLEVMRRNVGSCREWVPEKNDRCGAPSEYVLWGKLFDPEALGPRCYDHAAQHVGHRALGDPSWAIVDLGRLARDIDAEYFPGASSSSDALKGEQG